MENIVLLVHIILAVILIIVILIQRAEGGALGIGHAITATTNT